MELYRSINIEEAFLLSKTEKIFPKFFPGNDDSNAPIGLFSFWFKHRVKLIDCYAIVKANVPDSICQESTMTWSQDERSSYDSSFSGDWKTYSVPEIIISKPVTVDKIWIEDIFIPDSTDELLWDYDFTDKPEDAECFLEWSHKHSQKMFCHSIGFCRIRDYGYNLDQLERAHASKRCINHVLKDNNRWCATSCEHCKKYFVVNEFKWMETHCPYCMQNAR